MSDTFQQRLDRYQKAVQEMQIYRPILEQSYRLALPARNKWLHQGEDGHDQSSDQWDSTAVQALDEGASNVQSFLMPKGQRWVRYKAGSAANDGERLVMDAELKQSTNILMKCFDRSHLYAESIISIMDGMISVGLLKITENDSDTAPFMFEAVPMHEVAISEYRGRIENVWRKFKVQVGTIQDMWPNAKLSTSLAAKALQDPTEIVELVESTIFYPGNKPSNKYIYRVSYFEEEVDLLTESREWSPWIPFRMSVTPGETWGTGPVRKVLALIRKANMISRAELLHASLNVEMPIVVNPDVILNTETFQLDPGSVFQSNNINYDPFKPINVTGNLQFTQLSLQQIQQEIRDAMFADPLGPVDQQNQTATEIQIRQTNAIQKRAAVFTRLYNELVLPIVDKATRILVKRNLLKDIKIKNRAEQIVLDGMIADIDYDSPLIQVQNQNDLNQIQQFYQVITTVFGPTGAIAGTHAEKLPAKLATLLPGALELAKQPQDVLKMVQTLLGGQQQQNPPPGNASTAAPPNFQPQQSMQPPLQQPQMPSQ